MYIGVVIIPLKMIIILFQNVSQIKIIICKKTNATSYWCRHPKESKLI